VLPGFQELLAILGCLVFKGRKVILGYQGCLAFLGHLGHLEILVNLVIRGPLAPKAHKVLVVQMEPTLCRPTLL